MKKFILHLFKHKSMLTSFKYFGLLLIIAGIITLFIDQSAGAEIPLLAGLFIFFITKEKRNDERAVILKASSAYTALILGYAVELIIANLNSHNFLAIQLSEINYFLIMVFALAIIIFYTRMFTIQK